MAKASKIKPWLVQMKPPALDLWYDAGAYRDKKEADMQARLARSRAPEADWRVIDYRTELTTASA